jgi:hypothetical protein
MYSALLWRKLPVKEGCLNKPGNAEEGDEQVNQGIQGRDIHSQEIRIDGFRQGEHSHPIGNKET